MTILKYAKQNKTKVCIKIKWALAIINKKIISPTFKLCSNFLNKTNKELTVLNSCMQMTDLNSLHFSKQNRHIIKRKVQNEP
jgi:hypothetical protein